MPSKTVLLEYFIDHSIKVFCDYFIRVYLLFMQVIQINYLGDFYGLFISIEQK